MYLPTVVRLPYTLFPVTHIVLGCIFMLFRLILYIQQDTILTSVTILETCWPLHFATLRPHFVQHLHYFRSRISATELEYCEHMSIFKIIVTRSGPVLADLHIDGSNAGSGFFMESVLHGESFSRRYAVVSRGSCCSSSWAAAFISVNPWIY